MSPLAELNVKVARGLDLAALLLFSICISPGLDPSAMPLHVEFIITELLSYWSLFSCKTQPGLVELLQTKQTARFLSQSD